MTNTENQLSVCSSLRALAEASDPHHGGDRAGLDSCGDDANGIEHNIMGEMCGFAVISTRWSLVAVSPMNRVSEPATDWLVGYKGFRPFARPNA